MVVGSGPYPYESTLFLAQFSEQNRAPPLLATGIEREVENPVAKMTTGVEPPTQTRSSLPLHYSEPLMVRFQDSNRDQILPESSDIACFWDCHEFRGQPCVLPILIEEEIWRVYGNFCCPECAAAYLFNQRLDSHTQWERFALLNRLYSKSAPIHIAPPQPTLRLFGGPLDILEYRAILAEKSIRVDVVAPPMISVIQVLDTKPIDSYDACLKNTFIPWEMDRMNRPGAQGLRLRRTKPIVQDSMVFGFGCFAKPVSWAQNAPHASGLEGDQR